MKNLKAGMLVRVGGRPYMLHAVTDVNAGTGKRPRYEVTAEPAKLAYGFDTPADRDAAADMNTDAGFLAASVVLAAHAADPAAGAIAHAFPVHTLGIERAEREDIHGLRQFARGDVSAVLSLDELLAFARFDASIMYDVARSRLYQRRAVATFHDAGRMLADATELCGRAYREGESFEFGLLGGEHVFDPTHSGKSFTSHLGAWKDGRYPPNSKDRIVVMRDPSDTDGEHALRIARLLSDRIEALVTLARIGAYDVHHDLLEDPQLGAMNALGGSAGAELRRMAERLQRDV